VFPFGQPGLWKSQSGGCGFVNLHARDVSDEVVVHVNSWLLGYCFDSRRHVGGDGHGVEER